MSYPNNETSFVGGWKLLLFINAQLQQQMTPAELYRDEYQGIQYQGQYKTYYIAMNKTASIFPWYHID